MEVVIAYDTVVCIVCMVACVILSVVAFREGALAKRALRDGEKAEMGIHMNNSAKAWMANAAVSALATFMIHLHPLSCRWMEIVFTVCSGIVFVLMLSYLWFFVGKFYPFDKDDTKKD